MSEGNLNRTLLAGAQLILDEVRGRLDDAKPPYESDFLGTEVARAVRCVEQLTGVVGSLVEAAWGGEEKAQPEDAKPSKALKVGDRLTTVAQLEAVPDGGVIVDNCEDAWQKDRHDWDCTDVEGGGNRESAYVAQWLPAELVWLPKASEKP